MAETSAQARPRLVVGGHLVTRDELAMKELDAQQQTEFSEQEMEERMQAMKIAMAQAAAAATDTGDAVEGDSKMAVVAANTDVATGAVTHTENDFDDDFFAITGEEVELKEQHVKTLPNTSLKAQHKVELGHKPRGIRCLGRGIDCEHFLVLLTHGPYLSLI